MSLLKVFEREKIYEKLGTDSDIINFSNTFPGVAYFDKRYVAFYQAGIYQVGKGRTILVLPWILKGQAFDKGFSTSKVQQSFLDVISEIKEFENISVGIEASVGDSSIEILSYSFLNKLSLSVKQLFTKKSHIDISEQLNVLKGRWDLVQDLKKGDRPLTFFCTYGTLSMDSPFLLFSKSFLIFLNKILSSKKNLHLISDTLSYLEEVSLVPLTPNLLEQSKKWLEKNKLNDLLGVVGFAENLIIGNKIFNQEAGLCYQFQMDKFFEKLIESYFKLVPGTVIRPQIRQEVLGGGNWEGVGAVDSAKKSSNVYSIPDILLISENDYIVMECKYKPLKIPLINDESVDQTLSSFDRNDRNQILSFLLGLKPSNDVSNRKITFALIFPCNTVEKFKVTDLVFDSAKLYLDSQVRSLVQNKLILDDQDKLRIRFIGINVSQVVESVLKKDSKDALLLLGLIRTRVEKEETETMDRGFPISNFEKVVRKRSYLASLVIDRSRQDKNLGRTKLAKILYLADAHLKLHLEAKYQREAAGPLDARFIYHEKWGIEKYSEKYSYFKTIPTRDKEIIRYTTGSNVSDALLKVKAEYYEKYENIISIIDLLSSLDTEESEIVATLYACWNDLLFKRNGLVTNDLIANDFHENWHPSKKRFSRERLEYWIEWMHTNDLIPDGKGPRCMPKELRVA